jgi:hypothetical protein
VVTVKVNPADAKRLGNDKFVMPWATRQARFHFEEVKNEPNHDVHMHSDGDDLGTGLPSLPRAMKFVKMTACEKRSALEQALLDRLETNDDETTLGNVACLVNKYDGQEDQLYDMISGIGARSVSDMFDTDNHKTPARSMPTAMDASVDDLLEIGNACGKDLQGLRDESLILKVNHATHNSNSIHVDGALLSSDGKERKMCEMFLAMPTIKTVQKERREYLVLRHPGAKIAYERPSGTAWFTCQPGHHMAMERATRLKEQWEKRSVAWPPSMEPQYCA